MVQLPEVTSEKSEAYKAGYHNICAIRKEHIRRAGEKINIGTRTYRFSDAYGICLDDIITVDLLEQLATVAPTLIKYVFRGSAFDDDIVLKDQTMRRLELYIAHNAVAQKQGYTVEFL